VSDIIANSRPRRAYLLVWRSHHPCVGREELFEKPEMAFLRHSLLSIGNFFLNSSTAIWRTSAAAVLCPNTTARSSQVKGAAMAGRRPVAKDPDDSHFQDGSGGADSATDGRGRVCSRLAAQRSGGTRSGRTIALRFCQLRAESSNSAGRG